MSGWVGKFVSYGVDGAGEGDIRFQDTWLRLFQEQDPRGRYLMKMIRKADQACKSWARAGVLPACRLGTGRGPEASCEAVKEGTCRQ